MIILGIDPGTTGAGFAVISGDRNALVVKAAGLIAVRNTAPAARLLELYRGVEALLNTWQPRAVAVERLYFAKNVKTAIPVAESRGVILLTSALAEAMLHEYTPQEIKLAVTGDGRADKTQVRNMIERSVERPKDLAADDNTYDAIAVALTCFWREYAKSARI